MIKIYDSTEKEFATNGLGTVETYKCEEEKNISLNGWKITVECPLKYADLIVRDRIATAETKEKGMQPFRIGNVEKKGSRLYFTARHVVFDTENYVLANVRPTGLNPVAYANWLITHADQVMPFSVKGSATGTCPTRDFVRKTLREGFDQMLEDMPDVVIDPDGWDINIYDSNLVGADRGQKVIYGRNMQDWNVNEDWSEVCTKILPEGPDGLLLPEVYLISDTQYDVPYTKTVSFEVPSKDDAGNDLTDEQKQDILRQKAKKYLQDHAKPKVSYDIKSDIPQTLHINDTVKVLHPLFTLAAHVQGYTYDCNSGRVKNLTFGNYDPSPAGTVSSTINTINKRAAEAKSDQQKAIEAQTALIKNLSKTGYVYIDDNEIDILDKLPRESADKVWRWTAGGLGFSSTGVNGTFTTAITQDGRINADFITAGVLSADLVKTGILKDAKGLNYWNMNTGELNLNVASTIGGKAIASTDAVQAASDKADAAQKTADAVKKAAIKSVSVQYAQGTSNAEPPASGWQEDAPAWKAGQYIWQRTATTMSDDTVVYSKSLCITGVQGEAGKDGQDAILLMIDSTNGNLFKNSDIATILTVTVITGDTTITNSTALKKHFGSGAHLVWKIKPMGETEWTTVDSASDKLNDNGFLFTISPKDINTKCQFTCELDA